MEDFEREFMKSFWWLRVIPSDASRVLTEM